MKKKKKHPSAARGLVEDKYAPSMFLRLCHRCLYLNEGSKFIEKCRKCESLFTGQPVFERDFKPDPDFTTGEEPIQEALNDFESENGADDENLTSEAQENSDEECDREDEKRNKRSQSISGLSVLW